MSRLVSAAAMVIAVAVTFAVIATACTVDAGEMADENRITFDELTEAMLDPESNLVLEDVDGIDLEEVAPTTESFCDAFAAVPLPWVDDAVVPIQMFVDAWRPVDDVPAELEADVAALRDFGDRKLDWHFGRIDREDRPTADVDLFARMERIADVAVAECRDLPIRIGAPDDWALQRDWEPDEIERRCTQSLETAEEGISLYRELRGGEPRHALQIELASLVDWYRAFDTDDSSPLWFVPELHGIVGTDGAATIVPLVPCDDA